MKNRKLGRTSDHRKALLRNMATSLIENGSMETTEMKAKELSSVMDRLVTLAKRGDLHARRQAAAFVRNVEVDEDLTEQIQKRARALLGENHYVVIPGLPQSATPGTILTGLGVNWQQPIFMVLADWRIRPR